MICFFLPADTWGRYYGKVWYNTLSVCHSASNIMLSLEALGDSKPLLPGVLSLPCCTAIRTYCLFHYVLVVSVLLLFISFLSRSLMFHHCLPQKIDKGVRCKLSVHNF